VNAVSLVLGCLLGAGLLLVASPFLWPAKPREVERAARGRMRPLLNQAGLDRIPIAVFALSCGCSAVVAGAVVMATLGVLALGLGAAIVGGVLPLVLVRWRAQSRRRASRAVWPDAVDHLVSAVRSGIALPDSVGTLAHAGPVITRPAFAEFEAGYRSTGNFGISLDVLKERLGDPIADRILETLRMSREVGGSDLTQVLRSLSADLRVDAAIRSEVEARQSWVMNAAKLGVAAPWVILVLLATRPEAAMAYNTAQGTALIVIGLGVTVVAYRVMLTVGRLPEEKRWFS
jgi:tight adherence protein B